MAISVSELEQLLRDYSRNQNLSEARAIRALDTSLDFVMQHIGVPGTEREYSFEFFDDQYLYPTPDDFAEPISLRYDDDQINQFSRFEFRPAELLFERVNAVGPDTRLWGLYGAQGVRNLFVLAENKNAPILIDSFDSNNATNWTASNDATNIRDFVNSTSKGGGALEFDVDVSLSGSDRATITRIFATGFDLSNAFENNSDGRVEVWIPNITNFTSISLNWGSDGANYYKATATVQRSGAAFVVGTNDLDFPWDTATVVGTPDKSNINTFWIDFDFTGAYVDTTGFRVDSLQFIIPDLLRMSYYTYFKGLNASGAFISKLTASTDTMLFGTLNPEIKQMVALFAAVNVNPSILMTDKSVSNLYQSFYTIFSRRFPKKRTNNLMADPEVIDTPTQRL